MLGACSFLVFLLGVLAFSLVVPCEGKTKEEWENHLKLSYEECKNITEMPYEELSAMLRNVTDLRMEIKCFLKCVDMKSMSTTSYGEEMYTQANIFIDEFFQDNPEKGDKWMKVVEICKDIVGDSCETAGSYFLCRRDAMAEMRLLKREGILA